MDPSYETVVDPSTLVWTLSAIAIHGVMAAAQLALIAFLVSTGVLAVFSPQRDAPWLRRLGAIRAGAANARAYGAARVGLGLALLLPLAVGAPHSISAFASLAALALAISLERGLPPSDIPHGRLARRLAALSAVLVAAFALWEGEDGLELGIEVISNTQRWRTHELEWQHANDVKAPKVGELAPDFELQDPSGATTVRLSDFRGKRPVALVFGSYT